MTRLLPVFAFVLLTLLAGRAWAYEQASQAGVLREGEPQAIGAAWALPHSALIESVVSPAGSFRSELASPSLSAHVSVWIRMADCESGDGDGKPPYRASWHYNGLHDGGLQFVPSTWNAAKRLSEVRRIAAHYGYAYHAPAWVQIRVADNWRRHTSWAQWPTCSRKLGLR